MFAFCGNKSQNYLRLVGAWAIRRSLKDRHCEITSLQTHTNSIFASIVLCPYKSLPNLVPLTRMTQPSPRILIRRLVPRIFYGRMVRRTCLSLIRCTYLVFHIPGSLRLQVRRTHSRPTTLRSQCSTTPNDTRNQRSLRLALRIPRIPKQAMMVM